MPLVIATRHPKPAAPDHEPPRHVGRFEVREEIGRGSNGVVYAAYDPVLGRELALKVITLVAEHRQRVEALFLEEAKSAAGLSHPGIVTVYDAGSTGTLAYIAMERLVGCDLHDWLASNPAASPRRAAAMMARVADAVHHAHLQGMIHRDIKPSNIFLTHDLKPKVLDFGVAITRGGKDRNAAGPRLVGTPNYMSPEQALGQPLDARSDVFSIGTILYEMLAGRRAYDGAGVEEILAAVTAGPPLSLALLRPDVPPALRAIVERALAPLPAARHASARALRNELVAFAAEGAAAAGAVAPGAAPDAAPGAAPAAAAAAAPAAGPHPAPAAAPTLFTMAEDNLPRPLARPSRPPRWTWTLPAALAAVALVALFLLWQPPHSPAPAADPNPPSGPATTTVLPPPGPLPAGPARGIVPGPATVAPTPGSPRAGTGAAASRVLHAPAPAPEPDEQAGPPARATGTVTLAISPWGEVVVDGAPLGVSPPLTSLQLSAGMHTVEVRNGAGEPYLARVEVVPGQAVALRHLF